jgi:hypothetical protein
MLTPHDDFPIHQTPLPIAHPASGSPNHYDRYWFNGFPRDGSAYLGVAMGHYPNRGVIDGAISLVRDGVQRSFFVSGTMPLDRATRIGPMRIEVLEPLRRLRVVVEDNETGLAADIVFDATTQAVEEPRQANGRDGRLGIDSTRLTQWGAWSGTVNVDGADLVLDPDVWLATRDRSWGERAVGEPVHTNVAPISPQVAFLWAPLHFDDHVTHAMSFERSDGHKWVQSARIVPRLAAPGAPTWGVDDSEHLNGFDIDLRWKPGTREIGSATLTLPRLAGGRRIVEFEPVLTFRMRGIGYGHPVHFHGSAHGDLVVGADRLVTAEVNPIDPTMLHVQTLCRVRAVEGDWSADGMGILEQFVVGEHRPSGLTGIVDGYTG